MIEIFNEINGIIKNNLEWSSGKCVINANKLHMLRNNVRRHGKMDLHLYFSMLVIFKS